MNIMNLYVYENRSMSNDLSKPLMLENLNVDNMQIHIPKAIDGTDMGTWAWWFVYQNAKKEKYSIPMTLEGAMNDEGEEEYISTVGLNHGFTGKHGTVMYAIEAIQADGSGAVTHEWHTKTYKLEIVYTLRGNQTEYDESESDIISALISRVNELIQSGAEIAEIAETIENAAETAQEVIDSIPADYSELSTRVGANTIALAEKADQATTYTKTEVDVLIDEVEVETDTTLEIAGAPADAAETGRQLGLIKADLDAQVADINESLGAQTEAIGYYDLDFVNYTHVTGIITAEGSFRVNANKDLAAQFEVSGRKLTVTANSSKKSVVSFLKTSASLLSNGDSADFATGETAPREVTAGQTIEFELPSDCAFILFTLKASNIGGYTPDSATIVTGGLAQQIQELNVIPDETLSIRGKAADSAETGARLTAIGADLYEDVSGDLIGTWVQGNYNASTGGTATSSKYIRLSNLDKAVKSLTCDSGYLISIYGFNASGTYLGMWKNDTSFSTSVSSGTLDYASMDITKLWEYAARLNIRLKSSSSEVDLAPSDASHVTAKMFVLQKIETNDNPCEFAGHDEICVFDKMLCIGDSLMEGGSKAPTGVEDNPANAKRTVTRGMYSVPAFITKRFGVVTTNWGISGSTAKSWYNSKSVSESDWGGYDSALIYIGSNDYTQITTGGMTVEESTAQSTTYLQNIITKLKADNPGIRIFICTLNPGTTVGTLAPYRIPLMQAIRSIASNDSAVFCIDLNEYSSFQAGSAYSNGHPTAIGYQWMFREITNYINWWIAKHPADFKWIRYIGTSKAVTGNVTPEDDEDDGSYEGDVDTGNTGN